MKVIEVILPRKRKIGIEKAKQISAVAKSKAKKANPGETENRGGWSADPHQGEFHNLGPFR